MTKCSTPTEKQTMDLVMASNIQHMVSVYARSSLQIFDSGAGILGVREQRKMTDTSRSSIYTIQRAFGEPVTPTVQGFLGPDNLSAVLARHILPQ